MNQNKFDPLGPDCLSYPEIMFAAAARAYTDDHWKHFRQCPRCLRMVAIATRVAEEPAEHDFSMETSGIRNVQAMATETERLQAPGDQELLPQYLDELGTEVYWKARGISTADEPLQDSAAQEPNLFERMATALWEWLRTPPTELALNAAGSPHESGIPFTLDNGFTIDFARSDQGLLEVIVRHPNPDKVGSRVTVSIAAGEVSRSADIRLVTFLGDDAIGYGVIGPVAELLTANDFTIRIATNRGSSDEE